jgi:periplasmic glucans biosynthesis protein
MNSPRSPLLRAGHYLSFSRDAGEAHHLFSLVRIVLGTVASAVRVGSNVVHRLLLLSIPAALLSSPSLAAAQERPEAPFSRAILIGLADELAKKPYVEPSQPSGEEELGKLSYDQYRAIRFQKGAAIWNGENRTFAVELFHPGFIYATPVNVNLVVGGTGRRVLFKNDIFEYGPEVPALRSSDDMGYSGFRVRAPINTPDYMDEFLVFQGASYFRAIGRHQLYGLSARGLAIQTARPEGEEFPVFTDFWIERPPQNADKLVIHALLQSPSVVGAYTFTAVPGDETLVDVDATLFARRDVANYGIAPLTSMFLFDASNAGRFDDYRLAVHDSDGLQALTGGGERIWRPLANPRALEVSGFVDNNPKGFGLLQRKREFDDYEDFEARYELRPSLWIEPRGEWGQGHVELVEIPTDREIHDNIIAYWQPAAKLEPGKPAEFSYRLRWTTEPLNDTIARVVATRSGRSLNGEQRSFAVDFDPATEIPEGLEIHLTSSVGRILDPRGVVVTPEGVYRVMFELDPERENDVELRLALTSNGKSWSETWLYRWSR